MLRLLDASDFEPGVWEVKLLHFQAHALAVRFKNLSFDVSILVFFFDQFQNMVWGILLVELVPELYSLLYFELLVIAQILEHFETWDLRLALIFLKSFFADCYECDGDVDTKEGVSGQAGVVD